ncbi:hypothetical protein [Caldimonas tepidiphila]|nr:hypothetical protein [Caldimonas tepidiphila]
MTTDTLLHLAIVDVPCTAISLRLGRSLQPVPHDIKRELHAKRRAPAR